MSTMLYVVLGVIAIAIFLHVLNYVVGVYKTKDLPPEELKGNFLVSDAVISQGFIEYVVEDDDGRKLEVYSERILPIGQKHELEIIVYPYYKYRSLFTNRSYILDERGNRVIFYDSAEEIDPAEYAEL